MAKKRHIGKGAEHPRRAGSARQGNKPGIAKRCKVCHFSACRCGR